MTEQRCFDCFHEFAADEPRFMVLKKLRDVECVIDGEVLPIDPVERRFLESMCLDPVPVCADCQGWYGDQAIPVTADEQFGY